MIHKNFILGVGVSNATLEEVLEFLLKGLKNGVKKQYIVAANPEIIVRAQHDTDFKKVLNNASLALPDGIGVIWAGKVLGKKFKERMTGVEILENLCKKVADYGLTVGFLGGRPKVAEETSECLQKKYPGLKVAFAKAGPIVDTKGNIFSDYRLEINTIIDILFVAFGAPKQEFWMSKNLEKLPVKLAIGVGGAFDYLSGRVPRAPKWLRNWGFEWLFRLLVEPWRLKRQLALVNFVYLVIKERLKGL